MLEKYLEDNIQVIDHVVDWRESIRVTATKLLEKKYITEDYIEAMINNVRVNGSYMIILPQIAIPHSRPEDGVLKTAISLLKLHTPVLYPEDKEVSLILVLAADDNQSHIELISQLANLLEDKVALNGLMQANSVDEVKDLIQKVEQ